MKEKQSLKCTRCQSEISKLDLVRDQKQALINLKRAGSPLLTIKRLQEISKLDLKSAKGMMLHINLTYGHCHRCNYQGLTGEYVICPKCKAVNTNWEPSI